MSEVPASSDIEPLPSVEKTDISCEDDVVDRLRDCTTQQCNKNGLLLVTVGYSMHDLATLLRDGGMPTIAVELGYMMKGSALSRHTSIEMSSAVNSNDHLSVLLNGGTTGLTMSLASGRLYRARYFNDEKRAVLCVRGSSSAEERFIRASRREEFLRFAYVLSQIMPVPEPDPSTIESCDIPVVSETSKALGRRRPWPLSRLVSKLSST